MNVSLVMFKSDGTRREFPLTKDRIVIGRTSTCDLRLALSSVSREHCEVQIVGGSVKVRDLDSSNGTFINSKRVPEAVVTAGDQIGVGPVVFTLVVDGKPTSIKLATTIIKNYNKISYELDGSDATDSAQADLNQPTVVSEDPIASDKSDRLASGEDGPAPS